MSLYIERLYFKVYSSGINVYRICAINIHVPYSRFQVGISETTYVFFFLFNLEEKLYSILSLSDHVITQHLVVLMLLISLVLKFAMLIMFE